MEMDALNDNSLENDIFKSKFCKDKSIEKGSIEMIENDKKEDSSNNKIKEIKECDIYDPNERKQFDYDTLNRDLADIEERLRQTRLSWSKTSGTPTHDYSGMFMPTQGVRKSWSMLDIERRTYSSASSNGELEKIDGEKNVCESPALSEGLLKWDYGADIGIEQDDSEDMEPITWPVTAEEAQRNEKDALNRRMKQSLSQGSFIASPDPEDKHNLINAMSMEFKLKKRALSQNQINHRHSNSVSTLFVGKFDDVSARQIMEQAEAAEKRLRERLETIKTIHLGGKTVSREMFEIEDKQPANEQGGLSQTRSGRPIFDQSCQQEKDDFISGTTKTLQSQLIEEFIPETNKSNAADDGSRSPASISNTGRTTTVESTHSFSDYAKAPIFQPDTYGTRTDYPSYENSGSLYAKRNKEKPVDRGRTICGIAPELDTISSRETLHITDDKKENSLTSACSRHEDEDNAPKEVFERTKSNRADALPEDSLQVKWDRFKAMRKDGDLDDPLYEKTNVRSATQYNPQNSHRQYSSSNTFTTITNVSPRYDSFATETFKSPLRGYVHRDIAADNYDSAGDKVKRSSDKVPPIEDKKKSDHPRSRTNQCLNTRSGPGRRIVGGSGGGKDEDDDDDISQTEKRRIRHSGHLRKLKKKFGSGQLDGETTASELEHDDASKYLQNSNGKGGHYKQLSQMLTKLSRRGVAEETAMDISSCSNSTSVDTMQLMDRMSNLLHKQKGVSRKNVSHKPSSDRTNRKHLPESTKHANNQVPERMNPARMVESEDGMLILKHLMLKQKVKWLADCAREEARRRKVKKLQRLMDMYEHGDRVLIPSDLETDTATLMGSEMGSQQDLDSQTDSYSQLDEVTPVDYKPQAKHNQEKPKKYRAESNSLRRQYCDSRPNEEKKQPEHQSFKERKSYPVSEAWHIPLREGHVNRQEGANESNWCDSDSPARHGRPAQRYRSPCSRAESSRQERTPNLSVKERVRMKYEFEMARQRNAHECQKDIRHTKTGSTKVAAGGLSWTVGSARSCHNEQAYGNGKKMFDSNGGENFKEKGNLKSELQQAFESTMESFISRSRQRQKRIKLASEDRRYESQMNMERARLFVSSGAVTGVPRRRPVTQPDPLSARSDEATAALPPRGSSRPNVYSRGRRSKSENLYKPRRRKVSKTEMKMESARKYQALPEVQAKYMDERKKARIQNNRMRMQHYGERVLQSVLRNRGPWVSEAR